MPSKPLNELASFHAAIGRLTEPARKRQRLVGAPRIRRILVAIDPDSDNDAVTSWAEALGTHFAAKVTLISVLSPPALMRHLPKSATGDPSLRDWVKHEDRLAQEALVRASARLEKAAVAVTRKARRGFPGPEIVDAARRERADLVIVGSHGHSAIERFMLGSVADSVKSATSANVLIAKEFFRMGDVLVPVDGSDYSRAAAALGIQFAEAWGTQARILHVFGLNLLRYEEIGKQEFRAIMKKQRLPPRSPKVRYVLDYGSPGKQIAKYAANHSPALIVLGSRGLGRAPGRVLGSASNRVAHAAPSSCLIVKKPGK